MDLYISGSNRKKNCYKILNDLKCEQDKLIFLENTSIKYCLGCSACTDNLENYCIIEDDMQKIYNDMSKAKNIIIASPIYMNFITGILKNLIDRLNPYFCHSELLKEKKIYLILVGQLDEEENREIVEDINKYFMGLAEFMEFDFRFLRYLSSGDIDTIDDVMKNYKNYEEIIKEIRAQIEK